MCMLSIQVTFPLFHLLSSPISQLQVPQVQPECLHCASYKFLYTYYPSILFCLDKSILFLLICTYRQLIANPLWILQTCIYSEVYCILCRGYMWNKIISKLFQPSLMSIWNSFISARGNLPEIISKLFHRLVAALEYFPSCSLSLK